ncbi:hypothetical protein Tco_0021235, partial [Tanacetum coccineum]
ITTRTLWWWFRCDGGVETKVERRLSGGDGDDNDGGGVGAAVGQRP